jgi:predicted dehydrogenase
MSEQNRKERPVHPSVRIGMLSFAHGHAYSYASALTTLPSVEIAGIYDADMDRGQGAAKRFATTYFPDIDALLEQELDGVIICSENAYHASMVLQAAPHVRNILCEKPIATTVADARTMVDSCHETNTRLQIAFPVRFSPSIQHLKALLTRQELGEIYSVKCTNHGSMPDGWFQDPGLAGGGAVIDHTVHVIDLLRWFWQTEVAEVYAEVGRGILHRDIEIDDAGLLSFQLANGIYGTLDTSWSRPSSYPTWGDVKIEVVAERGVITVDALRQALSVSSDTWGKMRWVNWGSDMDHALISDFIEMIQTDRPPSITGEDGLKALEVALAAYRSAANHRPIAIGPVA